MIKVLTAITAVCAIMGSVSMIIAGDTSMSIEWNMFKSVLFYPLFFIGIIASFWQKFSSYDTYNVKKDSSGNEISREKSGDITDFLMGHVIMPLVTRLILFPLMVAAIIYYPLMGLLSLLGVILPYLLAILLVVSVFFYYKYANILVFKKKRYLWIPGLTIVLLFIIYLIHSWVCPFRWGDTPFIILLSAILLSLILAFSLILTAQEDSEEDLQNAQNQASLKNLFASSSSKKIVVPVIGGVVLLSILITAFLLLKKKETPFATDFTLYKVQTETLNMRGEMSTDAVILEKLDKGEIILVSSNDGTWAKISDSYSYVSSEYITPVFSENASTKINIAKTTGLFNFDSNDDGFQAKRMSQADWDKFKINDLIREGLDYHYALDYENFAVGKNIYQGPEGKLQTILVLHEEATASSEYLVSYDSNGNFINCVHLASTHGYGGDRGCGIIYQDKVISIGTFPDEGDDSLFGFHYITAYYSVSEYKINEDLSFTEIGKSYYRTYDKIYTE